MKSAIVYGVVYGLLITYIVISFTFFAIIITTSDQKHSEVRKLFSNNGCTIYRFIDNGEYHYYSDCRGSTIKNVNEICGANCYERYEEIITTGSNSTNKK